MTTSRVTQISRHRLHRRWEYIDVVFNNMNDRVFFRSGRSEGDAVNKRHLGSSRACIMPCRAATTATPIAVATLYISSLLTQNKGGMHGYLVQRLDREEY